MKLSMWMIANRLNKYNINTDSINKNEPVYQSVRLVPKENCLNIVQIDENVQCIGNNESITIYNNSYENVFEILANIFDDYDNFEDDIIKYAENFDLESLTNRLYDVFNNPIVLFDKNYNVLALTKQYEIDDVNDDWKHYYIYGCCSLDSLIENKDSSDDFVSDPFSQIFRFDSPNKLDYMTCSITFDNIEMGRLTVFQKDRVINFGDQQLLSYLVSIIAPTLIRFESSKKELLGQNYLLKILMGVYVSDTDISRLLKYSKWSNEDSLKICLLTPNENSLLNGYLPLIKKYSLKLLPDYRVFIYQNQIIMIMNESIVPFETAINHLKLVPDLEKNVTISLSLPFKGLLSLKEYWHQAIFATDYGKKLNPKLNYYDFYNYAINYIINFGTAEDKFCACHPDIMEMYQNDRKNNSNFIVTISAYLTNERSLIRTANSLFIHRSTLIYRIKKIIDALHYDIENNYSRDYMSLSVRMIEFHDLESQKSK